MEPDKTLMRLPNVLLNPAALEGLVKKKAVQKTKKVRRPITTYEAELVPVAFQLSREHLAGLREEISAAEPVLHNVYEDIDIFDARESALNEVAFALINMRASLDVFPFYDDDRDLIRRHIDMLIEDISLIVAKSRYQNMPLLEPVSRIAPFSTRGTSAPTNLIDIVFIVSRSPGMKKDVGLVARYLPEFFRDLKNSGLDVRMGLQAFGRTSQPAGPMRRTPEDFIDDISSILFASESQNSLSAIQNALDDFSFRIPSHRHLIILADGEAHDDFSDMRDATMQRLREERVVLHAMSVCDRFTGLPLMVFDDLVRATGGSYINIDRAEYRNTVSGLAGAIVNTALSSGNVQVVESEDRTVPVGPTSDDVMHVKFPDFRPNSLGLSELKFETPEDFRNACATVEKALNSIAMDKVEKRVLQDYLSRILMHFDDIRDYRLDFKV